MTHTWAKHIRVINLLLLLWKTCSALDDLRLYPDTPPFIHGVASGDPLESSVLLWTRFDPDSLRSTTTPVWANYSGSFEIEYQIFKLNGPEIEVNAEDLVASGSALTDASIDFTVVVEVENLTAETYYSFFFNYESFNSTIGRTKTLPSENSPFWPKIGVTSCTSLYSGYLHVYKHMSESDIDLVVHLGDYIYPDTDPDECHRIPNNMCADPLFSTCKIKQSGPSNQYIDNFGSTFTCNLTKLEKFRWIHKLYHLDPDLREARRLIPFVTIYDNHDLEIGVGPVDNGLQAFLEHVPIRFTSSISEVNTSRVFDIGSEVRLIALDTRLHRSEGSLLGDQQETWLHNVFNDTTHQWKIVGSTKEVMPFAINRTSYVISDIFLRGVLTVCAILMVSLVYEYYLLGKKEDDVKSLPMKLLLKMKRKLESRMSGGKEQLPESRAITNPTFEEKEVKSEYEENLAVEKSVSNLRKFPKKCSNCIGCFLIFASILWIIVFIVLQSLLNQDRVLNIDDGDPQTWSGHTDNLMRIFDSLQSTGNQDNNIFITGDMHYTVLANAHRFDVDDYSTLFSVNDQDRVGVEFLPSSGSRGNIDEKVDELTGFGIGTFLNDFVTDVIYKVIMRSNPHIKHHDPSGHGYGLLDFSESKVDATVTYFNILNNYGVKYTIDAVLEDLANRWS